MYTFTLTCICSYTLTHSFVYTQTQIHTQTLTYRCVHIDTDTHSHAHMQPQPGYLSTLCPPGPCRAHCLWEMAPEPPSPPRCGPGQNRGPSHQAVPAQRCCAESCAAGGAWGQLRAAPRPGSPSAPCRGPHHRRETHATITNPTHFSPSLSQRQIPPVPGGFDAHGLMESHRKAHKRDTN